jgi:hypothetical protein
MAVPKIHNLRTLVWISGGHRIRMRELQVLAVNLDINITFFLVSEMHFKQGG